MYLCLGMYNFLFKHFFEFFEADWTISLFVYIPVVPGKKYCSYNFFKNLTFGKKDIFRAKNMQEKIGFKKKKNGQYFS